MSVSELISSLRSASSVKGKVEYVEQLLELITTDYPSLELVGSNIDDSLVLLVDSSKQGLTEDKDVHQLIFGCVQVFKSLASAEVGLYRLVECGICLTLFEFFKVPDGQYARYYPIDTEALHTLWCISSSKMFETCSDLHTLFAQAAATAVKHNSRAGISENVVIALKILLNVTLLKSARSILLDHGFEEISAILIVSDCSPKALKEKEQALKVLYNMSADPSMQAAMVERGLLKCLLPLVQLNFTTEDLEQRAASVKLSHSATKTLQNVAYHKDAKLKLIEEGAVEALLEVVQRVCIGSQPTGPDSGNELAADLALVAVSTLSSLAISHSAKVELVRRGTVEPLVAIVDWVLESPLQRMSAQERGSPRGRFREPTGGAVWHDPEPRPWRVWQMSMQREALQCLSALAAHPDAKLPLAQQGAVRAALRIVDADSDAGGDATLLAQQMMASLSVGEGLEAVLVAQGVAEALSGILASNGHVPADERTCALNTLTNLCAGDEATRGELMARGVAESLLAVLEAPPASSADTAGSARTQAALALMNLTASAHLPALLAARDAAGSAGEPGLVRRAARALIDAAGDGAGEDRRRYACVALANLAAHAELASALLQLGALPLLVAFVLHAVAGRRPGVPPIDDPVPVVLAGVTRLCQAGPEGAAAAAALVQDEAGVVAGLRARVASGCAASRAALDALSPAPAGDEREGEAVADPEADRPAAAPVEAASPPEQAATPAGPAALGWGSVTAATAGWSAGRRAGSGAFIGEMGGSGGLQGPALCVVRRLRAVEAGAGEGSKAEQGPAEEVQRLQAQLCERCVALLVAEKAVCSRHFQ